MPKRVSKKLRDVNQIAHAIVRLGTSEQAEPEPAPDGKNPAAVALGKLGGRKGGLARAKNLSKKRRQEIARLAARSRWSKRS